jgi:hypothetical protein
MLRVEVRKRYAGFFIPRSAILLNSNAAEGGKGRVQGVLKER